MKSNSIDFYFIFCLAGLGRRFKEIGIETPKYLLSYKKKNSTVLGEIISNLKFPEKSNLLFFCNKRDKDHQQHIENILNNLDLSYEIIYINDTQGQAETAFKATQYLKENYSKAFFSKPIAFFNGDTILKCRDLNKLIKIMEKSSGLIDCFKSSKPSYSYVKIDQNNNVIEIKEKVVISNYATSGLYLFSSGKVYYQEYMLGDFSYLDEIYISDVYKSMIKKNMILKCYQDKDLKNTIVLGTPKDYESYLMS